VQRPKSNGTFSELIVSNPPMKTTGIKAWFHTLATPALAAIIAPTPAN
jgi:hypothetical protein